MFRVYNNGWRDANSLRAWAFQYLPSKVIELDGKNFSNQVLRDSKGWLVDFYGKYHSINDEFNLLLFTFSTLVWTLPSFCSHFRKSCTSKVLFSFEECQEKNFIGLEIRWSSQFRQSEL